MAEQEVFKARSGNNVKNGCVFVKTLTLSEDRGINLSNHVGCKNDEADFVAISGKFDDRLDDVDYYA